MATDETGPLDLDEAIDALYAGEPDEFVAERNRLARGLRQAKRRDEARQVSALRRPSVTASALNQAARNSPDAVDALVAAGDRLRQAQQAMLGAGADPRALRQARAERRTVIAGLLKATIKVLRNRSDADHDGRRQEIEATLEAVSIDPEIEGLARRGRLTTAAQRPTGFGDLIEGGPTDGEREATAVAPALTVDELADRRKAASHQKRARDEEAASHLDNAASEAESAAAAQRAAATAAKDDVVRIEAELEGARARAVAADKAATEAALSADSARREADHAK